MSEDPERTTFERLAVIETKLDSVNEKLALLAKSDEKLSECIERLERQSRNSLSGRDKSLVYVALISSLGSLAVALVYSLR